MHKPREKWLYLVSKSRYRFFANRIDILQWKFNKMFGFKVGEELIWKFVFIEFYEYIHSDACNSHFIDAFLNMQKNAQMYFLQQDYWQSANPKYSLKQWEVLQMLSFMSLSELKKVDCMDDEFEMELFMAYINDEFPTIEIEIENENDKELLMELMLEYTKRYIDG